MITKACPTCGTEREFGNKHRNRPGFCSTRCAYDYRSRDVLPKPCPTCGTEFKKRNGKFCSKKCAAEGYKGFKHSEQTKAAMSAAWTTERRAAAEKERVTKVCRICGSSFPVIKGSRYERAEMCSKKCHTEFLKTDNPLKRPEIRARISEFAKNRPAELRKRIGTGVSKAWADGKFDGVRTGRCDWFAFPFPDGTTCKVQGTWELAFADWMESRGLSFIGHRGRIGYDFGGVRRNWYPDFWVDDWNCWVDVKSPHFYRPEKFDAIRACNPGIEIRVLLPDDLKGLGVEIYDRSGRHIPRLAALVQRCRVQRRAR